MKIAFFGTSDRSVPILEALNATGFLVLCVTKPDSKIGRKQEIKENGVKTWAKANNIPYLEVASLKGETATHIITDLKKYEVTYGVVADYSLMIPNDIIDYFNKKLLNIHFSLLPKYRGSSPVQFALLNGDKSTGITYLLIENKLDAGDIIFQIEYNINSNFTSQELYKILFKLAGENLPKVLSEYDKHLLPTSKQDESKATYTYSPTQPKSTCIFKEDAKLAWEKTPEQLECAIRAYNPWPIAWTTLTDLTATSKIVTKAHNLRKGIDGALKVKIFSSKITEGLLEIESLQVEGKNKTAWDTFENGYLA